MIFQKANESDELSGWVYDYEYTYKLYDYLVEKYPDDHCSQEQVETVLEAIENLGTT